MKKIVISVGILFLLVGIVLFRTVSQPKKQDLPTLHQQTGIVSKVDAYHTSKFGDVLYFELENIEKRFWLKARMEKEPGIEKILLEKIKVGNQLTAYYTSLEGTQYDYLSAPYNVSYLETEGETIEGLPFVGGKDTDTFTKVIFYTISTIMLLVGAGLLILGIKI